MEFLFEHVLWQHQVSQLNLKLFKLGSDFCVFFGGKDLGEKDPWDQLYRKELLD